MSDSWEDIFPVLEVKQADDLAIFHQPAKEMLVGVIHCDTSGHNYSNPAKLTYKAAEQFSKCRVKVSLTIACARKAPGVAHELALVLNHCHMALPLCE